MSAHRIALFAVVLFVLVISSGSLARAQTVEDVFPLDPPDKGTMGPKGMFRVGFRGTELGKVKFKIALSRDEFRTTAFLFDQMKHANGWALTDLGGESGAIFRPRKPVPAGRYQWKAWAWNGIEWVEGKTVFTLDVDGVPPADVQGIRMNIDREAGLVTLDWDPVVTDQEGRGENVVKYHVYRYEKKYPFFVVRVFEVGEVTDTHFEDRDEKVLKASILFYMITAEDEAGNEPGRRF